MIKPVIAAKSKDKIQIELIGPISDWDDFSAKNFSAVLKGFSSQYSAIEFLIHSPGGSVYEGIAMKNFMARSSANITFNVVGVAASMTSALLASADYAKASRTAKIMVHQASGAVRGSAKKLRQSADQLDQINSDLAEIYAEKTGKDKQWILDNWMKEGEDKWFTAKEALAVGLIDEIDEPKNLSIAAYSDNFFEAVACFDEHLVRDDHKADMSFEATLDEVLAQINPVLTENQNNSKMKLIAKFLGLSEDATEQQIIDAIQKRDDDAAKAAANLFVAMGEKSGQITAENKSKFEKLAQTDLSLAVDFLPSAEVEPTGEQNGKASEGKDEQKPTDQHTSLLDAIKSLQKGSSEDESRAGWDWTRWSREDPKGLEAMARQDPEKAAKLLNKSYGLAIKATEISNYL